MRSDNRGGRPSPASGRSVERRFDRWHSRADVASQDSERCRPVFHEDDSMCEHVKNPTQLCFAPVRGRLPFDKQGRCLSTFGPRRLGTDVVKNAQPESSLMRDPRLKHRSTRVHSLSWMEYQERNDLCNGSRSVITSAWSADVITERTCAERWRSAWP